MLTLRTNAAYTRQDLEVLRDAITTAYMEVSCDDDCYCPACPKRMACEDLARLVAYLTRKTRESDDS